MQLLHVLPPREVFMALPGPPDPPAAGSDPGTAHPIHVPPDPATNHDNRQDDPNLRDVAAGRGGRSLHRFTADNRLRMASAVI